MKLLIEIASIAKRVKLKMNDLLLVDKPKPTKADLFYEKIINEELTTDEAAAKHLFDSHPNSSNYKNLKHELREKLLNTLFFLDPQKSISDYESAYLYCCKYLID